MMESERVSPEGATVPQTTPDRARRRRRVYAIAGLVGVAAVVVAVWQFATSNRNPSVVPVPRLPPTPVQRPVRPASPPELSEALRQKDVQALDRLLAKNPAWVNSEKPYDPAAWPREGDGATPLHEAVRLGNADIARALVTRGADVNARNRLGLTPLHQAVRDDRRQVLRYLVKSGKADVNAPVILGPGVPVWATYSPPVNPAYFGAPVELTGCTPLHFALAKAGPAWPEVGEVLLDAGADPNTATPAGYTPLHMAAAEFENGKVIDALLRRGARVNARPGGLTPLEVADFRRGFEASSADRLIASGAKPNRLVRLKMGFDASDTPGQRLSVLVQALEADPTLAKAHDAWGRTALYYLFHGLPRQGLDLLWQAGADVNATDRYGRTTAHNSGLAADVGLTWLLAKGADINARDAGGRTPLHCVPLGAADLVAKGAMLEAKDASGLTPLHHAAMHDNLQKVQELLSVKADVNATGAIEVTKVGGGTETVTGLTPLHLAIVARSSKCIRPLLDGGADLTARDSRGRTPLNTAVETGDESSRQAIAERGGV